MRHPDDSYRELAMIGRLFMSIAVIVWGAIVGLLVSIVIAIITYGAWYGVGDVELAKAKIHDATTKAEVRAILGVPHSTRSGGEEEEWDYRDNYLAAGSILRVFFGPDERVTHSEWWLD